jgi:midasin (ATPase involved in ribosome maturation)
VDDLREVLLAAWRLVIFSESIFTPLLPHLPLLSLLHHPDPSIRYLAIELLTFRIGLADAAKAKWTAQYIGPPEYEFIANWENMSVDYGVMPLFESDRIYYALQAIKKREYYSEGNGRKLMPTDLGKYTGEICGVLIPRFDDKRENVQSGLVKTENTRVNLRGIAKTIVDEKPLLLQSVPGAGKSFLIDEVAKLFGRYDGKHLPSTVVNH